MHISRIKIKGFRNFRKLDLGDLPPTLILVGENGTGKSNLLHALRLVLDPSLPDTRRQLGAEDFWDGWGVPFDGHEISISVELAGFDGDKSAMALLSDYLVAMHPSVARLTYAYRPRSLVDLPSSEADYEFALYGGRSDEERVGRDVLRHVSLRVLPALRDAESDLGSARSPLRRLLTRIDLDPNHLEAAQDSIVAAGEALLLDGEVAAVSFGITERLAAMVGDMFAPETSLGIASTDANQLVRSIRLFVDETRQRSVGQTSLGTANLLYLALLLEQIAAQQRSSEIVTQVLAVEEPEAHLHPHLQRVLFRHLLDDGRPLIVTTHSAHLASVAPLSSLTLLRATDGETKGAHTRLLGLAPALEEDIQRYLDVTRAEMLFAKGVILVEGAAEEFLVPAFAAAQGFNLDAHGITVCSVRGTDFLPYRRLLSRRGLGIPHVIITDGDQSNDKKLGGIGRGRSLVGNATRNQIDEALERGDRGAARAILRRRGIFVGQTTLELDLLPNALDAMSNAYCELETSDVKQANFRSDLEAVASGDTSRSAAVLDRINRIGKGRFAQRLASSVQAVNPPGYVKRAISRIRSKVCQDE